MSSWKLFSMGEFARDERQNSTVKLVLIERLDLRETRSKR